MLNASFRSTCLLLRALFPALALFILNHEITYANASNDGLNSFVSRPDIHSPKWKLEVFDEAALAPGYWFMSPYRDYDGGSAPDKGMRGPHIYDQDGSLIWSPVLLETAGRTARVEAFALSQVDMGEGGGLEQMMTMMNMPGQAIFIDDHYQIRKRKGADAGMVFNSHELNIVDDGTIAMTVFTQINHNTTEEERRRAGIEGKCLISCNGIQEYDVKTWERGWKWNSCEDEAGVDHIALQESSLWSHDGTCPKDYIHANSVDKTPEGDYLYSCRHTDTLYKISKKDGRIIWRLNGRTSDFVHKDDFHFSRQHHVRYRGGNSTHTILSILDNARANSGNQIATHPFSRGLLIALDEASEPMTAQIVAQYDHPDGEGNHAFRRGGMQLLPNGNVFMAWSEDGLQSEHSADGKILMRASFAPDWMGSYRAFKFDGFVGLPLDPPDVVARVTSSSDPSVGNRTEVFVSWNGATEVAKWRLFETTKSGEHGLALSTITRAGFEGRFDYAGYSEYVIVEALARNDSVLGTSNVIKVIPMEMPWFLQRNIFLAASAITVATVLVMALIWWAVSHFRRKGGTIKLPTLNIFARGRYQPLSDKQREAEEQGNEPLMDSDEDIDLDAK